MKIRNNFLTSLFILLFFLNGCSFKNKDNASQSSGKIYIETVAKPDATLRDLKVSLPKPVENNSWSQSTNNEAHQILHPLVGNQIKFFWKKSIGKGQNKKRPFTSQPVIDSEYVYTIDTELTIKAFNKNNGKIKWTKKLKKKVNEYKFGIISGGLSVN